MPILIVPNLANNAETYYKQWPINELHFNILDYATHYMSDLGTLCIRLEEIRIKINGPHFLIEFLMTL